MFLFLVCVCVCLSVCVFGVFFQKKNDLRIQDEIGDINDSDDCYFSLDSQRIVTTSHDKRGFTYFQR